MKTKITICILVSCPSPELSKTIKSLFFADEILVGYTNFQFISHLPNNIKSISVGQNDLSASRNHIVAQAKNDMCFWLEPDEVVASGTELLDNITNKCYFCQRLESNIVTKPIRIHPKTVKWENPIFETLNVKAEFLDVLLVGKKTIADHSSSTKTWIEQYPALPSTYYYHAYALLSRGRYDEFLHYAQHYLFLEPTGTAAIMTRYHIGIIELYKNSKSKLAGQIAAGCLIYNPLMAEFWCLLADAYFKAGQNEKALLFYENAILLGKQRKGGDEWPIDLDKYGVYPKKMIETIKLTLAERSTFMQLPF